MEKCVTLLLDDGVDRPLDYLAPCDAQIGMRALVPLRSRSVKGTIIATKDSPEFKNTKPIQSLLPEEASVPPELFELASWMSRYYCTSLRRILRMMVPSSMRGKAKPKLQRFVKRLHSIEKLTLLAAELRRTHPSQAQVLDVMLKAPKGLLLSELLEKSKVSRSPIDTLTKHGILEQKDFQINRTPLQESEFFQTKPKKLNDEQQKALDAIAHFNDFNVHLIHGITGSGKTEVYLQAIDAALKENRGVIMLVPEIALTAQTIERLKARLPTKIAILHHRLSDGERFDTWQAVRSGEIRIAIGARSALFSPIQNLGLIIVDEEHDNSYKQSDEMPCYHARDVAIVRAKLSSCPVVLGSATPALESFANAQNGKYKLHTLHSRATDARLPKVHIVDMQREYEKGLSLFSDALLTGIKQRFEKGEQTLLFLNRRGYNPYLKCSACGKTHKCPDCDVSLTFHKSQNTLYCHTCGFAQRPPPTTCPSCHAPSTMQFKGAGTEQIERALHAIFPDIRAIRMDADTTRHKGAHDRLFKQFRAGKADVLIGTQMITKGLHFPSVTLVGVLNSDAALNIPDFRASEQTFQLIAQVSGRSGRSELPGEVIIQTQLPDHPIIVHASTENYPLFFEEELSVRKLFDYPPHTRLARFVFSGIDEVQTQNTALAMREALTKHLPSSLLLLPVTPCGCARIKKNYRFQFLVKGASLASLHGALDKTPLPHRNVRMIVDIDPISVYF